MKSIIEFARRVDFADLSARTVHAVVRNYLDCVGCAAGGFDSNAARAARQLAVSTSGSPAASAYGLADRPLIDFATFANAAATRATDYNDVDAVSGAGHPSDMNPALAAMAEAINASGADLVCAMFVAYEVMGAIGTAVPVRDRGWDQGILCSIGAAAGLGNLLKLDEDRLANAIAIAITPSIPLRITRAGELSDWKGAATAHAVMTATFATRLAQAGMTGPRRVFDGIEGLFAKVTGPFELGAMAPRGGQLSVSERVQHKQFPVIAEAQAPVQLMLELREQFGADDVQSIRLTTEYLAWHEGGGGQGDVAEKWDPQTRETADHSLPYAMAVALVDGEVTIDSFRMERVKDPALRPLMRRIEVVEDPEYTARRASNGDLVAVVDVTLHDGRTYRVEARHPRGHRDNPMTDQELEKKFNSMIDVVLLPSEQSELRERLWDLPQQKDLHAIATLFRSFRTRSRDDKTA